MYLSSRRAFLFGLSAAILDAQQATPTRGQTYSSDAKRYIDPTTEFPVLRLTSPAYTSYLTAPYNRGMSGRNVVYFSSDRTGRMEIYRCDVRNGQSRLLSAAEKLDPFSLALLPGDRAICFFDGSTLRQLTLAGLKDRDLYTVPEGFERAPGFSLTADGARAFFVEHAGPRYRLQTMQLARGTVATLVEADEEISYPVPRPGHPSVLYRRGGMWHLVGSDGKGDRVLALAPGEALSPTWSPDGSSVIYLNVAPERGQLNTIRELNPDTPTNTLIAKTTQYIAIGANGDASVFVGASGSKASPHVLILVRSVKRELTLCEHKASDSRMVSPVFAPSSQRIYFGSDQHGKPAIYTMNIERFVEETES